ncbi:4028_t:CDS:1 [Dentiscutata erythropus]|uniref:4028_t:CDS:1 n=1 Tax=Dentiscutata erythropus TaxID=1348616 RepID=A0A9N9JSE3_9GLOM|nr:4028_t:CDS:1 [Dentiscutata erythropus]
MCCELTKPDITIKYRNIDSDFVFVYATLIQETVAIERIISLFIEQKDNIEKLLNSHPIYAMLFDLTFNTIILCHILPAGLPILLIVLIKQLTALFDNQFVIINRVVEKQNEASNDNNRDVINNERISNKCSQRNGDGNKNDGNKNSDINKSSDK